MKCCRLSYRCKGSDETWNWLKYPFPISRTLKIHNSALIVILWTISRYLKIKSSNVKVKLMYFTSSGSKFYHFFFLCNFKKWLACLKLYRGFFRRGNVGRRVVSEFYSRGFLNLRRKELQLRARWLSKVALLERSALLAKLSPLWVGHVPAKWTNVKGSGLTCVCVCVYGRQVWVYVSDAFL